MVVTPDSPDRLRRLAAPASTDMDLIRRRRRRRARNSLLLWRAAVAVAVAALVAVVLGLAFAGSPARIADGVRVAGVDVGGLEPEQAQVKLERREAALANVPVTFVAAGRSWKIRPAALGLKTDWRGAIEAARDEGGGFGPLRGFRRLDVKVFGADVTPRTQVWETALNVELLRLSRAINRPAREPAVRLAGLHPHVVAGRPGLRLDRAAAASVLVHALAGFSRTTHVHLPLKVERPNLVRADLAAAAARARVAVSAPVRLTLGPTAWRVPRWRVAQLLELPQDGRRTLRIGGPAADAFFAKLAKRVDRAPKDAAFAVSGKEVGILPDKPGLALDADASARRLLAASLRRGARQASLVVATTQAERTAADARAMGITSLVSGYTTIFGGVPNRIHNVQLVSHLIDDKLIPPGSIFSFNKTTGARTADKGFLEAPVIINGELETGLGGGVCQVSTTVFNAAYEAGLKITERTNHALYISHYPQGRDATVDYPNIDLKFVNDTGHWLLLRTYVSSSSLTVDLFGTPTHRRVESQVAPLVETGPPIIERTVDASLAPGERVIDDYGEPSRRTSVRRLVYNPQGRLLYDDTWTSSYRSEPRIVRIGPPKPKQKKQPTDTTTTETTTTPTETTPDGIAVPPTESTPPSTTSSATTPSATTPTVTTP
jgi:vancomycin resistance protein YoaR